MSEYGYECMPMIMGNMYTMIMGNKYTMNGKILDFAQRNLLSFLNSMSLIWGTSLDEVVILFDFFTLETIVT